MQVCFFGRLGELIGRSVELGEQPATVAELRQVLAERFPGARNELMRPSLRACVGGSVVVEEYPLGGVAEVDFLPPLSGG